MSDQLNQLYTDILALGDGALYYLPYGITGAMVGRIEQRLPLNQQLLIVNENRKDQRALKYGHRRYEQIEVIKKIHVN